jgi:ligand-binding sensor domain-containing protein
LSSGTLQTPARKRIGAWPHSLRALLLRGVLTVIVVALSFHSTAAQAGEMGDQRILHESWAFKDGAPEPVVALAQTVDGYLWLGSPSGCFASMAFASNYSARAMAIHFRQLMFPVICSTTGGLWIGYRFGGFSFQNGNSQLQPSNATVHGSLRIGMESYGLPATAYCDSMALPGSRIGRVIRDWGPSRWDLIATEYLGFNRGQRAQFGRQLFYLPAGGGSSKAGDLCL